MELQIGNKQGYVVIDDNTGKIMNVLVKDGVKGKFDFRSFTSYKREGDKHYNIRKQLTTNEINEAYNKFSSSEYYE
jgi:nitrogen regulatory protein PII-like uncharacterized protein